MSDENRLDLAFKAKQLAFEQEQLPVRKEFDELVRTVMKSQIPRELGFGVDLSDNRLSIYRDGYRIEATIKARTISINLSNPDGASYERTMLAALSSIYRDGSTAEHAADQIGALMAHIVEDRLF